MRIIHSLYHACYIFIILLTAACTDSPQSPHQANGEKALITHRIDSIASYYASKGQLAGFAIAVLRDGDTIYNQAFGYRNLEQKLAATTHTRFDMASVTKLHTAVAAMKLVEEGRLSLDQTLLELMPDFPRPNQASKITVQHLLSHSSGLADYTEYGDSLFFKARISPQKQDYMNFLANKELYFEPGTSFSYSNTGFILMAFIIEKVSDMLYEDFIEQIISQPLGLSSLKHLNRNWKETTSHIYQWEDSGFERSEMDSVFYFKGDGALSATAIDLAHVPPGLAAGKVISSESLTKMKMPIIFPDGNQSDYGLGMRTGNFGGYEVWGHTGGHHKYLCMLAYFPEKKVSIAVLTNTVGAPTDALSIEGEVAMAVLGISAPDLASIEKPAPDSEKYTGIYHHITELSVPRSGTLITLNTEDDHLYRKREGSESKGAKLFYLGNHTFAYQLYPMDRMVFNMDDRGMAVGFRDYYNGLFGAMRKRKTTGE